MTEAELWQLAWTALGGLTALSVSLVYLKIKDRN